jgi:uncharacterized protein with beta-barrel porin domain
LLIALQFFARTSKTLRCETTITSQEIAMFLQTSRADASEPMRSGAFMRFCAIAVLLSCALVPMLARAQSVANGSAIWYDTVTYFCYSCHGGVAPAVPLLPQRNAANSVSVLSSAIVNNAGGFMNYFRSIAVDGTVDNGTAPLSAAQRADLAAFINSVTTSTHTPTPSVAYGGMVTVSLQDIRTTASVALPASAVINAISTVTAPTRGTLSAYDLVTPSVTYTHTATNCTADSFTFRGTGLSGAQTSTRTVNVSVTAPAVPTIADSSAMIAYNSGASTNIPLTIGGGPALSLNVGALSGGAGTLSASGTTLSYTASATTYVASQTATVQVVGPCANSPTTATITINVGAPPAPVITSAASANGTGGQPFSFTITASNAPTSFAAPGLPAGLMLNTTTGAITGTPTVSGMFNIPVTATNFTGTSGTQMLAINIGLATPVITSPLVAAATSGSPFSYTITASNLPATFNATGLPSGLAIDTATGAITGTPVVVMAGAVPVTITATNAAGTGMATLTLNISLNAPTITSANTASGTVGSAFSFNITGTDFPTSYSATGLPPGLMLNTGTGAITGTPTLQGAYMVTVNATNGAGTSANQTLTITIILLPPVVTAGGTISVTITSPVSYQIAATNSPTSYAATGLPAGVTINTTTGLISGTPTAVGTSNVTISATNAAGTGTASLVITVNQFPPPVLNSATVQVPFGGTGVVDFFLLSGGSNITSYVITTPATRGSVAVAGTVATYTPQAGFFGTDSIRVTAMGPGGTSPPATITFIVGTPGAPTVSARSVNIPYETATAINLTAAITGVATSIAISTPPANGTATVSGMIVTYTPKANYFGEDSFAYTASGPGGASMPATVTITVGSLAPTASAVRFAVPLNTPTNMDLKPFIRGSAITGVRVTAEPKFGKAAVNGTQVIYTPNTDFFGDDTFTYIAFGNAGTSAGAIVTVTVVGRPDPTKSANVSGIVTAQAETAQRFARAQIGNIQNRMESLHRTKEVGDANAAKAPRATATASGPITEGVTGAGETKALKPVSNAPNAAKSATPASALVGDAIGLVTTRGVNAATVAQAASGGEINRAPDTEVGAVNYWVGGSAQFGVRDPKGGFTGSDFTTSGISIGADRRFTKDMAAGLAMGFGRDRTTIGTDGSNNKAQSTSFALYGSYQPSANTFFDALAGFGRLNFTSRRVVSATGGMAEADRDGKQFFASFAGGYERRNNGVLFSPYGRLDYTSDRLDAATETGAGIYALDYSALTQPSLQGTLGMRAESIHRTEFGWAAPRARFEFRHEFQGARDSSVSYADLASTRYALVSAKVLRNAIVASVGSDFQFKRGLTLGVDYQVTHAFNKDSSQGLRLTLTQPLDGKGTPIYFGALPLSFAKPQDIQADAGYVFDSNITRAKTGPNKHSDRIYSANLGKGLLFTFEDYEKIRLSVNYAVGGEKFDRWVGLDRAIASLDADAKYKTSAEFDAITYGATLAVAGDQYHSVLRRGYRASLTLSARQQVTDRIGAFAAISHNQRWAKSSVWDNRFSAIRLNADYAWSANDTLYLTGEFRKGHVVSTGTGSIEDLAVAQVFVDDDAFGGRDYHSYRFEGKTWISTVGFNMGFGPRHALDLSWRRAQSTPDYRPSFAVSPKSYVADQYSIIYLIRF